MVISKLIGNNLVFYTIKITLLLLKVKNISFSSRSFLYFLFSVHGKMKYMT